MSDLAVHNTLTGKLEEFKPQSFPEVKMYVCGPTVYDDCHVGHARAYVAFDVVRRFLEYSGYQVKYVQNFTDIDDKILNRAEEEGKDFGTVARENTRKYFDVMDRLNIQRADVYPTVSGHIPEIIEHVEGLLEKGRAYEIEGDVYFKVASFENYGELSGQDIEEMMEGERVEADNKESSLDFALWKKSTGDEPGWDSPWGRGRPGWHIECSVMSRTHLGDTIDIHGGGRGLVFPHHENEIAQTTGLTGKKFVRYWLHNGFVTIESEKMSKSLGNYYTLKEIYEKFPPPVVRYFILTRHYRNPINFSFERLQEAREAFKGLQNFYQRLLTAESWLCGASEPGESPPALTEFKKSFLQAMNEDFNTAQALGVLQKWSGQWNSVLDSWSHRDRLHRSEQEAITGARTVFEKFSVEILGLDFSANQKSETGGEEDELLDLLLQLRSQARDNENYKLSDKIRDRLREIGFEIHDTPRGPRWERLDE